MFDIFLCKMAGDVVFTPVNVIFLKFRPLVLTDFLTLAAFRGNGSPLGGFIGEGTSPSE